MKTEKSHSVPRKLGKQISVTQEFIRLCEAKLLTMPSVQDNPILKSKMSNGQMRWESGRGNRMYEELQSMISDSLWMSGRKEETQPGFFQGFFQCKATTKKFNPGNLNALCHFLFGLDYNEVTKQSKEQGPLSLNLISLPPVWIFGGENNNRDMSKVKEMCQQWKAAEVEIICYEDYNGRLNKILRNLPSPAIFIQFIDSRYLTTPTCLTDLLEVWSIDRGRSFIKNTIHILEEDIFRQDVFRKIRSVLAKTKFPATGSNSITNYEDIISNFLHMVSESFFLTEYFARIESDCIRLQKMLTQSLKIAQ